MTRREEILAEIIKAEVARNVAVKAEDRAQERVHKATGFLGHWQIQLKVEEAKERAAVRERVDGVEQ